ncbi:hypothetical protein QR680_008648 [Steinernema hermaphroditum]|uniref:Uncharacterized protein n=1 Tax=Steinernema hermaphroditum TaxID=289476 RepID=A0AA39M889_9BILA|nr:hypothetical protein QR680_008648 [Steinernema hermaphroditum]
MCLGIFELWTIIFTHSGDEVVTPWENPTIAMVSTQLHDKKSYKKRKQWKEIQDVSTTTIVTIVPSGNDGAEISPAGDERRTEEVSTSCSATERYLMRSGKRFEHLVFSTSWVRTGHRTTDFFHSR